MGAERADKQLNVLITGFGPFKSIEENPSWMAVKELHGTLLDLQTPPAALCGAHSGKSGVRVSRLTPAGPGTALVQTLQVPVHYGSVLDLVPRLHGAKPTSSAAHFWHDERLDKVHGGQKDGSYPLSYPAIRHPESGKYDVVIHVGVGKTGAIRCETQAHKTGYNVPDANHCLAPVVDDQQASTTDKTRGFGDGYHDFKDIERTSVDVADLVSWLHDLGEDQVEQSLDPGRYLCDFIFYCSMSEARRHSDPNPTVVIFIHVPPVDQDLSVERCRDIIYAIAWYIASKRVSSHHHDVSCG